MEGNMLQIASETDREICIVSYLTYKKYAKKYKIPVSYVDTNGKRTLKTINELREAIYNHESLDDVSGGLYF